MKGTKTKLHLAVLSSITSMFITQGEIFWNDEGIQCSPIETQTLRLGTSKNLGTFIPLATPQALETSIINPLTKQQQQTFARKITYEQLTPYTDPSLFEPLCESFIETPSSWHPFYVRLLSNVSATELMGECSASNLADFTDQKSIAISSQKRTTDLHFIKLEAPEDAPFLSADQAAFELNQSGYSNIAVAIFANPKFFGDDINDKESLFYMNISQGERTFLCFPGLFALAEASKVVRKVTWCGKDRAGNDIYEPFDLEKTLAQGALPRYRYSQDGTDKDLAPGPEIIKTEEDGSLGFKETPQFSTFAIKDACMCFVSTTETFEEIRDKHGRAMCAYNPLNKPIDIDLIFTATPEIPLNKLPVNTFLSVEYLKALIEDLKTQMGALSKTESKTFITGAMGCDVFGNDMRAVALAYAYVFMYHRPETLVNIAITDEKFYSMLKSYWGIIDVIKPTADKSEEAFMERIFNVAFSIGERQFNMGQKIFHKILKESVPLCPANSELAQAFDELSSQAQKKGIEKIPVSYDYYQTLGKMKGVNFHVNRAGKFITELIKKVTE